MELVPGQFEKVDEALKHTLKHTLKVVKVSVQAHMHLVNEHGEVVAETSAQPITLFPSKFGRLKELVTKIEEESNKKEEDIKTLASQVLF